MAKINDLLALSQNPNVRKMLDLISYTEHTQNNGYYTAFGGGRLSSLADHPRYKKHFRQTDGRMNTTSAAGRYQFLRGTWDGLARKYGFSDFSPRNQDLGAVALLIQRGAMPHLLKGDFAKAIAKSGAEWASLPTSPHPQPTKSWKQVNAFLGGKIQIPQSSGYEPQQQMGQFGSIDEALAAQKQSQPIGKFSSIDEALASQRQAEPLGKYANIDEAIAAQQPKGQYGSIDEALGAQTAPQPQVGQFGSIEEALKHLNGG